MKQIDRLLIRSFIAPFITTFFIALFVLIMQFLWTYIDDIIGKGASFLIILELLSYLTISLIPTALPIAILISSVMVMGNLAEHYELASIKSAGVPLLRVMAPLMVLVIGVAVFSFFCSNNIIPIANLQFKSRLYDIRKQKPALSLEEGVFNEDFKDFIIHIGKKSADSRFIEDVLIYDHTTKDKEPLKILAQKGEMFMTDDDRYFIMNLFEGTQYQESQQGKKNGKKKSYPFVRTTFKEWNKVFDLSEFEIARTEVDLFDSHHTMLSVAQLRKQIDTLGQKVEVKLDKLDRHTDQYLRIFRPSDTITVLPKNIADDTGFRKINGPKARRDSIKQANVTTFNATKSEHRKAKRVRYRAPLKQNIEKPLTEYASIDQIFSSKDLQRNLYSRAQTYARNLQSQALTTMRTVDRDRENRVKHIYELNIKFSMAAVCFIFLFIGAPMGAIVRKGGFGYPILVAIFFFMLFIVLNILFKKLAESFVLSATLASWLPCAILFPLGLLLTYRAMNDMKVFNTDRYVLIFQSIVNFFRKKEA